MKEESDYKKGFRHGYEHGQIIGALKTVELVIRKIREKDVANNG